jgi:hypothetical protein
MEVLGGNPPQYNSVYRKSHMKGLRLKHGCHGGKPTVNCISYSTVDFIPSILKMEAAGSSELIKIITALYSRKPQT